MAVLALVMKDEDLAPYQARCPEEPQKAITETLAAFKAAAPAQVGMVLTVDQVKELRGFLGNSLGTPDDLLTLVRRGASVQVRGSKSGLYLALTERQKKNLTQEAERTHQTEMQALQKACYSGIEGAFGVY